MQLVAGVADLLDHELEAPAVIGAVGDDQVLPVSDRLVQDALLQLRRYAAAAVLGADRLEDLPRVGVQHVVLHAVDGDRVPARVHHAELAAVEHDRVIVAAEDERRLRRAEHALADRTWAKDEESSGVIDARCDRLVHMRVDGFKLVRGEVAFELCSQVRWDGAVDDCKRGASLPAAHADLLNRWLVIVTAWLLLLLLLLMLLLRVRWQPGRAGREADMQHSLCRRRAQTPAHKFGVLVGGS